MTYLTSALKRRDFTNTAASVENRRFRWNSDDWADAADEALAYCEAGGIDPRHFFTSIAESMGYFCEKKRLPLQPAHIKGAGAVDRYNRWLERNQAQSTSADATFAVKQDRRLHAEHAYVEVFAAVLASGNPDGAHKIARSAALEVDARYTRCSQRRVIALSDYLHRLHHALPDMIVLNKGWTTREVLTVSFTITTP